MYQWGLILLIPFLLFAVAGGAENDNFYKNVTFPKQLDPQLALIGPSRIQLGKSVELQLVSLAKDGEPSDMPNPPVVICEGPVTPGTDDAGNTIYIEFQKKVTGIYKPKTSVSFLEKGYYLLTAKDQKGDFLPFGLPVYVDEKPPDLQLHWGDLHGHSTLSDGLHPAEEYYRWARDVACMDVMALTDHNWALNDEKIRKMQSLCKEWYKPGKFVPFFAFEWAMGAGRKSPSRGRPHHKHLVFRHADEKLAPWMPLWHNTPSVAKLWEMLEGRDVIAVPHHTGLPHATHFGTDWSLHSEKFERLAEVFSDWGSSEMKGDRYQLPEVEEGNFLRDALAAGYHIGFVGGSDTHRSRPGLNALPRMGHPYALTALTAIEAPERTRESLWKALYNQRCYATSGGRRHLLDFSVNGAPMGSRLEQSSASPRKIEITVAGSTDIVEIIIVKNGKQVASFPGKGWCCKVSWIDREPSEKKEDFYYARAEMKDTSMAWSSPVWVMPPSGSE